MTMEIEDSYFDDLDRKFLNLSSAMADLFSRTYGMLGYRLVAPLDPNKFDNASTVAKEVAIRALIVFGAIASFVFAGAYIFGAAVILGLGSKIFREAGFYFQKDGFTHIRGSAPETTLNGNATVMVWNIRGYGGGLHYGYGVVHWKLRIDRIVEEIRQANPDVLVLQDIYDTALVEALQVRLGGLFAHTYAHMGESGTMVMTKCAVHHFSHTEFADQDDVVKRGFETLEIKASPDDLFPCARVIGTKLTPGNGMEEIRMRQVAQIVDTLARQKLAMPTLFVGSLTIDRDGKEGEYLSRYLYHSYLDKEPTYSDQLVSQWAPIFDGQERVSDFISFFKRNLADGRVLPVIERNIRLVGSGLVKGFDADYNTKRARSDCNGVVTQFSGLVPCQRVN